MILYIYCFVDYKFVPLIEINFIFYNQSSLSFFWGLISFSLTISTLRNKNKNIVFKGLSHFIILQKII